jgi:hypothetical protein
VARKSEEKREAKDMWGREPTAAAVQSSSIKGSRGSPIFQRRSFRFTPILCGRVFLMY